MAKLKKPNLKRLRKQAEDLAKLVAKERDNWTCQHCGAKVSGVNAQGSHIIPVSHGNSLRFNPKNILCLCYHCHLGWWHKNPLEAGEWFSNKYPELKVYLDERKNLTVKFRSWDYEEMIEQLKLEVLKYKK